MDSQFDPTEDLPSEILYVDHYGPFDDDADDKLSRILGETISFTINYKVKNLIPEEAPATANCYLWELTQNFNF